MVLASQAHHTTLPQVGHNMGNPWVTWPLPAPTLARNPYLGSWVWVLADMGMGSVSSSSALDPSTSGSFMWGLEGVKVSQGAAESGAEMGSIGRGWSETVLHACAQLETLHVRPFGSGTRCVRVVKAARECGMLGNARNKQCGVDVREIGPLGTGAGSSSSGSKLSPPPAASRSAFTFKFLIFDTDTFTIATNPAPEAVLDGVGAQAIVVVIKL
ncbi:hypothetical protein EDB84DRAFT_1433695 [Lactarius hengduanensis]|nr:hypothetical protein EDB84DRAFT_1433695 [Lactarius hengduanensis]